jgi:hypothetical protein
MYEERYERAADLARKLVVFVENLGCAKHD